MITIQIILHWQGDWSQIDKELTPCNTHIAIPEMVDGSYLVLLDEPDQLDALEIAMENQTDVTITGAFNMDGSVYLYGNGVRDYTIAKYRGKLKDVVEYDENGEVTGSHPPSEVEALNTQCNLIAGHPSRVLG